ncbi:MAG: hypothetical protein RLO17_10735 [Cyclobacteriaceae bacterium]
MMMRVSLIACSFLFFWSAYAQSGDESVILSAMRDELKRNMNELKSDGYKDPFFIGYGVTELKTININAMNGGIFRSSLDSARSWYTRVMVGDYAVNDENYNDPNMVFTQDLGYTNLPLDDNYNGIRRSLWISTNNIYKAAARLQKSKTDLYKEMGIKELPLKDFAEAPKVQIYQSKPINIPDIKSWEEKVSSISKGFLDVPEVFRSAIGFFYIGANHYFVNSEGIEVVTPHELGYLSISVQMIDEDYKVFAEELAYLVSSVDDLPSEEVIEEDIKKLKAYLRDKMSQENFEDIYYGPLLVEGDLVSDVFMNALMVNDLNITAERDNLNNTDKGLLETYITNMKKEMGRGPQRIANPDLTVTALSHMETYDGVKLIGNFTVDSEGVIPPDSLMIVENGRLVTQLNGRTPVPLAPESNGHNRLNFNFGGTFKSIAPGILSIESKKPTKASEMKKSLIRKAEEIGLDYALLFRPVQTAGISSMFQAYKVDVATGEETPVRIDFVDLSSTISLFRVNEISDKKIVSNQFFGTTGSNGINGVPISLIVPDAILVDGFEISGLSDNFQSNNRYVPTTPSPLAK